MGFILLFALVKKTSLNTEPVYKKKHQPINQSINPFNQSKNQSTDQPVNHKICNNTELPKS